MTSLAFLPLRPHLLRRTLSTCLCRESISSHEAGVNFNLYRIRGNIADGTYKEAMRLSQRDSCWGGGRMY
jgi:hypothetical protein